MAADLDDAAAFQGEDAVGVAHGGQAVGDDEHGAAAGEALQRFLEEKNPWALRAIVERLLEAVERGLWAQPEPGTEARLKQIYLELEGQLEERGAGR